MKHTIIPRNVLFGNPSRVGVKISPDGKRIGYIAPSEKNVLNVWVRSVEREDDVMVTSDMFRGIRSYGFTFDNRHIIYIQDKNGDENWHLYRTDLETRETEDITPFEGVRAQNLMLHRDFPDQLMVGLNRRDKSVFDMYRMDLRTGVLELDTENPGDVAGWLADRNFKIRACIASNPDDGSETIRICDDVESEWREIAHFPFGENGAAIGFTEGNDNIYVETSIGRDTTRLIEMDPQGNEIREIACDEKCDIGRVLINAESRKIEAVGYTYEKHRWNVIDEGVKADFELFEKESDGEYFVVSRNRADTTWIVAYLFDDKPFSYYIYDRKERKLTFLFTHHPELENYELAKMEPVIIKARDGLDLVSYITCPKDKEPKNLPMVLLVHGGPWARDGWGYDSQAQWLANRGYAVLQVNFRASTGFGKSFLNAGNGEWGVGSMQHDLTDAVKWAIEKGIADPEKVAIMGGSYGGYATLAGLTFTPDLYTCGVDIVGPSNLRTLMETIPDYWKPFRMQMIKRIGDVEKDAELNEKISPLYHVEKICKPLMIGQGSNDPRVKISESDQIVEAMRKADLPVTYIVFPDEGHGFARPENRLDFYGRVEEFLKTHLGGECEPYEKIEGSSAEAR